MSNWKNTDIYHYILFLKKKFFPSKKIPFPPQINIMLHMFQIVLLVILHN